MRLAGEMIECIKRNNVVIHGIRILPMSMTCIFTILESFKLQVEYTDNVIFTQSAFYIFPNPAWSLVFIL